MSPLPQKVSLDDVKANIASVRYITGNTIGQSLHPISTPMSPQSRSNLARLTICVIELKNGFICTGMNTCVDMCEWQEDLALKYSYEAAVDRVWEVMGYELTERRFQQSQGIQDASPT